MGDPLEIATKAALDRVEDEDMSPAIAAVWAAFTYDLQHERDIVHHRVYDELEAGSS